MDRTGLGLPIYQYAIDPQQATWELNKSIKGYNFSEKIPVAFEAPDEDLNEWEQMDDDPMDRAVMGNVLEYSSDTLRLLVDQGRLRLPWDIDMLKEFQGQAYYTAGPRRTRTARRSSTRASSTPWTLPGWLPCRSSRHLLKNFSGRSRSRRRSR
jgi:hypothetical protein